MKNISNLMLKILLKSIILPVMIVVINYHFIQSWKFYGYYNNLLYKYAL